MSVLKKVWSSALFLSMISMPTFVASCSNDEENTGTYATVDGEFLTHGISTEMESAIIDVPVKSAG